MTRSTAKYCQCFQQIKFFFFSIIIIPSDSDFVFTCLSLLPFPHSFYATMSWCLGLIVMEELELKVTATLPWIIYGVTSLTVAPAVNHNSVSGRRTEDIRRDQENFQHLSFLLLLYNPSSTLLWDWHYKRFHRWRFCPERILQTAAESHRKNTATNVCIWVQQVSHQHMAAVLDLIAWSECSLSQKQSDL